MPTNITPALAEWMKLYEAPFALKYGSICDAKNKTVMGIFTPKSPRETALGTFIAEQLNELYEQNKENGK